MIIDVPETRRRVNWSKVHEEWKWMRRKHFSVLDIWHILKSQPKEPNIYIQKAAQEMLEKGVVESLKFKIGEKNLLKKILKKITKIFGKNIWNMLEKIFLLV